MASDSSSTTSFGESDFLFPAEWQAIADIFGDSAGLILVQDGKIAGVNRQLSEQLGFAERDLIGKPVESLFPLKNAESAGAGKQARHDGRRLHGTSIQLADSKGETRDFHLIVNRIDTLSGARVIWVLQAAEPRQSAGPPAQEALQAMIDHEPGLVCIADADGTMRYASPSFAALLGHGPTRLNGVRLTALTHHEDRARLEAMLAQTDAQAGAVELRIRHKDGSWRHIAMQMSRLAGDAAGSVLLHGHDVTEERLQQRNLALENKRQLHYVNRLLQLAQQPQANVKQTLKVIVKAAPKALGVHRCAYWQVDEDPSTTRCVTMYDDIRQSFGCEEPDPAAASALHPLLHEVRRSAGPMSVDNVDLDPRTALYCEYFHSVMVRAVMLVPVRRDDRVVGVLTLADARRARRWRKDEVAFAVHAASLVAMTLREAERTRAEAQLRHIAQQDSLTGLPNRQFLFDQASDFFPKITETSPSLAAFFIDLDGFKSVNDTLGHAVGDELLKAAALRLKNVVRKDDVLARLGGDEFMLIARNLTDMRIANDIALQVVETMRNPFVLQGAELQISASVGIALYPFDGTDIETLMKKADIAMYHAKSAGRDQYQMFNPALSEESGRRRALEKDLRHAVECRQLQHYYQPQIDTRTGEVVCVEAFLRWPHPHHGVLLPSQFLPLAEESGMIHDISAWAIEDACGQLIDWRERGIGKFGLALNLSASQLLDHDLPAILENAFERTGVSGPQLECEIREETILHNNTLTAAMLERVGDMRLGLSIDDFGTGYSSLGHLLRYPVRKVKIDRSFVNGLPLQGEDRAITDAIISMAQPLGLEVVAEGVETPEQMDYLREHGCHIAQGYYFTPPLPAEQFETWLTRH